MAQSPERIVMGKKVNQGSENHGLRTIGKSRLVYYKYRNIFYCKVENGELLMRIVV